MKTSFTLPSVPKQNNSYAIPIDNTLNIKDHIEIEIQVPAKFESEKESDVKENTDNVKDPYKLPDLPDDDVKWADMSTKQRTIWVILAFCKAIGLISLLYVFVCTLDFLSSSFRLLGGKIAGEALGNSVLISNPVAGLMVGVLATVLVQSSSTSTTIVVSMISADIISVKLSIPIIMGANIGTTVTNTLVAMGQTGDRDQFRRAFAGATVHDMFNWLCVIVLLPLEVTTGYLFHLTTAIKDRLPHNANGSVNEPDFLKQITQPFTSYIVSLDSKAISDVAQGKGENLTTMMKDGVLKDIGWNDTNSGILLLVLSLVVLCICLVCIVKLLNSVLAGNVAKIIRKIVNANSEGILGFLTGLLAIVVGAGLTFLVQSSSIFTSAITPLVGLGIIHIDRMYPLTLGSNIGTTGTSLLAALASAGSGNFENTLQIALCHLFFNITGVTLFYIIYPLRKLPINAAKYLGNITAEYRWFAVIYIIMMFFIFPALIFGLSLAGWQVLLGIGSPVVFLIIVVIIVNIIQWKRPSILPEKYRTWEFLPAGLHSLKPYDSIFVSIKGKLPCKPSQADHDDSEKGSTLKPFNISTISR